MSLVAAGALCFAAGFMSALPEPRPESAVHVMSSDRNPFVGTVWRVQGGWFVTALHVPKDETGIMVDGRPAEIVAYDTEADLCVLRVNGLGGPCLPLGEPQVGQDARVVGFVGVGRYGYPMQTYGRITSLNLPDGFVGYDGGIQPGLSGSPVVDAQGYVLGVVSSAQCWGAFQPANATMGRLGNVYILREMLADLHPGSPALPIPTTEVPANSTPILPIPSFEWIIPIPEESE